ncbi:putative porin [Colwellia sp. RE-S-Sl-9]
MLNKSLYLSLVSAALATISPAQADVSVNGVDAVKLFGDMRLRFERTDGDTIDTTSRARLRARFGIKYAVNDDWSAVMRFRTTSSAHDSTHQTFGITDTSDNDDFGLDKAYMTYKGIENATIVIGKASPVFMHSSELLFRDDIALEGIQGSWSNNGFSVNAGHIILEENKDNGDGKRDASWQQLQGVYEGKINNVKYKLGLGKLFVSASDSAYSSAESGLHADQAGDVMTMNADFRMGAFRLAADYYTSDADSEDTAYTVHARYQMNDVIGMRFYVIHTEAYALPMNGAFTQTNTPGSYTNIKGTRLQFDYKVADNLNADLRWYSVDNINESLPTNNAGRDRFQVNLNMKF